MLLATTVSNPVQSRAIPSSVMGRGPYSDSIPIYEFSDPAAYLRWLYETKKRSQKITLRALAQRSGFRSPAALSMIFNRKRRLTSESADRIGRALDLTPDSLRYLVQLARFTSLRSETERARAFDELAVLHHGLSRPSKCLKDTRFLARWYYPVILLMTELSDFRWNADWISRRLGKKVTPDQVRIAIGDLINLRLLRKEGQSLVRSEPALRTEEDIPNPAIRRYHSDMLKLAIDSIALPIDKREMSGLTVAIRRDQIPELKDRIRAFRSELNRHLSQREAHSAEELVQINIHFFPLLVPDGEENDS